MSNLLAQEETMSKRIRELLDRCRGRHGELLSEESQLAIQRFLVMPCSETWNQVRDVYVTPEATMLTAWATLDHKCKRHTKMGERQYPDQVNSIRAIEHALKTHDLLAAPILREPPEGTPGPYR